MKQAISEMIKRIHFNLHHPVVVEGVPRGGEINFVHPVISRPEEVAENENPILCEYAQFLIDIMKAYLYDVGYRCNYDVLRIAVNATVSQSVDECAIHCDHDYDHHQVIICLNDNFSGGATRIYDDNEKLAKRVESEVFKGYSFGAKKHSVEYPTSGIRVVAVYTLLLHNKDSYEN